jgi:hypothetical protein
VNSERSRVFKYPFWKAPGNDGFAYAVVGLVMVKAPDMLPFPVWMNTHRILLCEFLFVETAKVFP